MNTIEHTKNKSIYLLFLVSFLIATGCSGISKENQAHPDLSPHFDVSWASDKLWDDGKAEVAFYEAERNIYGKVRHFEYVYIVVKETFNEAYHVKTDDYSRNDLYEVLKVNQFARIETDNYPYHFLSSLFFTRNNATLLQKGTVSSQEWCGNTFKSFERESETYNYNFNSYWDNEGAGSIRFDNKVLFEDQLAYSLRALNFNDSLVFQYPVLETQVTNKATQPTIYKASFMINSTEVAGEGLWQVTVHLDQGKRNQYVFRKEFPNIMVRQTTWDGRNLTLKSFKRDSYWQ